MDVQLETNRFVIQALFFGLFMGFLQVFGIPYLNRNKNKWNKESPTSWERFVGRNNIIREQNKINTMRLLRSSQWQKYEPKKRATRRR